MPNFSFLIGRGSGEVETLGFRDKLSYCSIVDDLFIYDANQMGETELATVFLSFRINTLDEHCAEEV